MPVNWTAENDRKLLLLMLKATDCKVNYAAVQKMWGPNPPTVKAITHRVANLKKMARENQPSGRATPATAPSESSTGLATPIGSPKAPSKRSLDSDEEVTPRRMPKRRVRQNVKYIEPEIDESDDDDWHSAKETDSDQDDEWVPEGEVAGGASGTTIEEEVDATDTGNGDAEEDAEAKIKEEGILEAYFDGKDIKVQTFA